MACLNIRPIFDLTILLMQFQILERSPFVHDDQKRSHNVENAFDVEVDRIQKSKP